MVFGINYLAVLDEIINDIRVNVLTYIKSLIIGFIFFMGAPSAEMSDTFTAHTTMTKHDIELASKLIDAFIQIFTSSVGVIATLYITWRFDKWKKIHK